MTSPQPFLGDETYHMRHPLHPVQPLRTHPQSHLSETEKRQLIQARRNKKEISDELQREIENIRAECDLRVKTLTERFPQKETYIRSNVYNVSSLKPQRNINSWNAEVSYKAKELRESTFPNSNTLITCY
jgi:hypothetical protein